MAPWGQHSISRGETLDAGMDDIALISAILSLTGLGYASSLILDSILCD
jgi:hypothetical protein